MDFDQVIARVNRCGDPEVSTAIIDALGTLLEKDDYLFRNDVHERTIGACLAWYLKPHFPDWHVDPEYNKHGSDPKRVTWKAGGPSLVVPDIIVHKRGPVGPNRLVIEIKKSSNDETSDDDRAKLRGMRADLQYTHALFVRFGVGDEAGTITECDWA